MKILKSIGIITLIVILGVFVLSKIGRGEIDKIKALTSVTEQSEELLKLLDRVGPVKAQEELLASGLPFTGETHLLVHTIGDYIYNKYGLGGIQYCRDYFLSACYHGFIINTLGDHGLPGMKEVMDRCEEAPPGVMSQCAHGAGHGFVAWHDYDLLKALEMCDTLGGSVQNFPYFNCYDGVFMENLWGVHNGVPSEKRWVKDSDIYYPCNDSRIPEKYLHGCWANQASLIFQRYQGDLRKTALACDAVASPDYRTTCYDNLSRQIHPLTNGDVEKVFSLCSVATGQVRQDDCVITNMVSYYSVGDRTLPEKICERAQGSLKTRCEERLRELVNYYGE